MTDRPDLVTEGAPEGVIAAARAYFDRQAPQYRLAAERGMWAWQRRREASAVLALATPIDGRTVLDLGCGAGFYARRMADHGARSVVAVDASPAMLAAIGDGRIETVAADAATVRLSRRFDRVILAGLLEFVADPEAVLANAGRHLADGGRLVVLAPPDSLAGRLYRRFHRGHGLDIRLFTLAGLTTAAAAVGLRLTACRAVPPYALVCALEAR